jgi:hypothetical protein
VSDQADKWESCNTAVNVLFMDDWMINYHKVRQLDRLIRFGFLPHCDFMLEIGAHVGGRCSCVDLRR